MGLYHVAFLYGLASVFIFFSSGTSMPSKWKKRKEECKMKEDTVSDQQQIQTLMGCLTSCDRLPSCESVSWSFSDGSCILSHINVVDDKRAAYTRWDFAAGWLTYSKVNYPIATVMNPDPESDRMTFNEAGETCINQRSELATPDQLIEAKQQGMDCCTCGWLSNGENGGLASTSPSCDISSTDEVEYCNNTEAIAWCKLN